ncbi:hypothetical protein TBLA_0A00970 [Henningerozyma blattae CBS 6284]|uniref:Probable 26S proteasome regulatory subunit p27 n=1 Tax=Henningerozyma blattae (strain ATCC 34711 / CBS 6284 / DSM 70876 / NBRC 10599 / NRRL Y-10934 / UCD 77-7) TaxID=1071380 RepID=I2GUU5_HENB6|nr:hypothetical protein TBLA_0A00970 [Tetrapisispora blattae CBS 6284]CCH57897.1 hypothetical protein TBLA_0A00970 [Tetrapisispora blattae CBS 6284]
MEVSNTTDKDSELGLQLTNVEIPRDITEQVLRLDSINTIKEIDSLKMLIELQLESYFALLKSQDVTMESNLITSDGFPRSDIDVLQIRLVRKNIIMLQNDLKKVLDKSYILLNKHFEELNLKNSATKNSNTTSSSNSNPDTIESKIPFSFINELITNGPMDKAGANLNDKIIKFGSINVTNHQNLKNLQLEVLKYEDKTLNLTIERDGSIMELILIPTRNWNGRGLLGCRIQQL